MFIYGIKGIPLDDAIRQGFDDTIASHANIKVVAEGEGQYLGPDGGIKATQDILQITDSFDVMVGADQSIRVLRSFSLTKAWPEGQADRSGWL